MLDLLNEISSAIQEAKVEKIEREETRKKENAKVAATSYGFGVRQLQAAMEEMEVVPRHLSLVVKEDGLDAALQRELARKQAKLSAFQAKLAKMYDGQCIMKAWQTKNCNDGQTKKALNEQAQGMTNDVVKALNMLTDENKILLGHAKVVAIKAKINSVQEEIKGLMAQVESIEAVITNRNDNIKRMFNGLGKWAVVLNDELNEDRELRELVTVEDMEFLESALSKWEKALDKLNTKKHDKKVSETIAATPTKKLSASIRVKVA